MCRDLCPALRTKMNPFRDWSSTSLTDHLTPPNTKAPGPALCLLRTSSTGGSLRGYDNRVNRLELLPVIPLPLRESSATALEWPRLRDHIAGRTSSPLGQAWILALEPSSDIAWINQQQQRTGKMRTTLARGGSFEFHGLFDPTFLLDKARIDGAALESTEIRDLLTVVERVAAWRNLINPPANSIRH